MPELKLFIRRRITTDRGKPLPTPVNEVEVLYDGRPLNDNVRFEFSVDLANNHIPPVWNFGAGMDGITPSDVTNHKGNRRRPS